MQDLSLVKTPSAPYLVNSSCKQDNHGGNGELHLSGIKGKTSGFGLPVAVLLDVSILT